MLSVHVLLLLHEVGMLLTSHLTKSKRHPPVPCGEVGVCRRGGGGGSHLHAPRNSETAQPLSPVNYDTAEYQLCVPRALTLPRSSPPFPPSLVSAPLLWPSSDHTCLPGSEESTGPRAHAPFSRLARDTQDPGFPCTNSSEPTCKASMDAANVCPPKSDSTAYS